MKSDRISDTTPDDVPLIQELFTPYTASWFGHDLVLPELIEKSYICLSQRSGSKVLSVICLDDFPPVRSIPKDAWLEWTREIYHCPYLSYKNAVFVHLLAWSPECQACVEQLLVYVFEHYPALDHLLLVIPPYVDVAPAVLQHFRPMRKVTRFQDTRFGLPFYVNSRSWTLPEIKIRWAEIEQTDYIMEILAQKQPEARVSYTPQLIKELLEPHDAEHRLRLVALKGDRVVAFMILDKRVHLQDLQDSFDFSLYILKENKTVSSQDSNASHENIISDSISDTSYHSVPASDTLEETEDGSKNGGLTYEDISLTSAAFAISVFAVESSHEYTIPIILKAVFRNYCPDCDLCFASTPSDRTSPLFQFMNHVSLKQNRLYPNELYALSKAAALGAVSVRASAASDSKHIASLLEYYEHKKTIMQEVFAYLSRPNDNPTIRMLTICVDTHNIIGFALISSEMNFSCMEAQFVIHDVMNYNAYHHYDQAVIKYIVLSYPFLTHGRFILKEILRQLDLSCLYYFHNVLKPTTVIPDIIQMMFPMRPRELVDYPSGQDYRQVPSSLYFVNKRISSILYATNHVRAVVVGASPAGLSFLESLIYDRTPADPCFTRLTLISEHDLWYRPHKYQELVDSVMVGNGETEWSQTARMDMGMWVTVRIGAVTEINTEEKYITINNSEYKQNYEYLFLAPRLRPSLRSVSKITVKQVDSSDSVQIAACRANTTRQDAFQIFTQEHKHNSHKNCEADLNAPDKKLEDFPSLHNVFCISNMEEAGRGLDYVEHLVKRRPFASHNRRECNSILILGNCLGALACVQAVLSLGTRRAGYKIILVEPQNIAMNCEDSTHSNYPFFTLDNIEVTLSILLELTTNQVILLRNARIYNYGISSGRVTWVKIKTEDMKVVLIQCCTVFVFAAAGLERTLCNALNGAKVLMYQKILIDTHYRTNVPNIYAVGLSTRYNSRLFAEDTKYFSQVEIGEDMSRQLRKFLNSNHTYDNDELPEYKRCLIERCTLPGGYYYLHVHKPGEKWNSGCGMPEEYFTVTTGQISREHPRGYFQLIFDKYRTLTEITCVSTRPLHVANTVALYGKHAGLLNNILQRHSADPIPDLYDYFEQPWALALYHFNFNSFLDSVASLFHMPNNEDTTLSSLIEKLKSSMANPKHCLDISVEIRRAFVDYEILHEDLSQEQLYQVLVRRVVQFLERHADQLPVYATAGVMQKILPEDRYHTPRRDLGDTCSDPSLPQRGYHLPGTEAEQTQELAYMLAEDATHGASTTARRIGLVGADPEV